MAHEHDRHDTRSGRIAFAALAGYLGIALLLLHPMAFHLGDSSFYLSADNAAHEDTLVDAAIIYHKAKHLLSGSVSSFYQLPMFHPYPDTGLFTDVFLTHAMLAAPLVKLEIPALVVHDVLNWIGFPLSAFCMFLLARKIFRSASVAFVCGLCFAFCPYQLNHLVRINLRLVMFYPLVLLFALHFVETKKGRYLFGAATSYMLHSLANGYFFLFGNLFLLFFAAGLWYRHRRTIDWITVRRLFVAALLVIASVAAVLYPYLGFNSLHGLAQKPMMYVATPTSYLSVFPANWIWGDLLATELRERALFFGLIPSLLVAYAVFGRPGESAPEIWLRNVSIVCVAVAVILSFGPSLRVFEREVALPYSLLAELPGFRSIRVTSRFALFAALFSSLLVGWGLQKLVGRLGDSRGSRLVVPLVALLTCLEYSHAPLPRMPLLEQDRDRDRLHAWLVSLGGPPILNLPTGSGFDGIQARYTHATTQHTSRTLGGKLSEFSPLFRDVHLSIERAIRSGAAADYLLRQLEAVGIRYIISWSPGSHRTMLRSLAQRNARLSEDRRFGEYAVYRLERSALHALPSPGDRPIEFELDAPTHREGNALWLELRSTTPDDRLLFNPRIRHAANVRGVRDDVGFEQRAELLLPPLISGRGAFRAILLSVPGERILRVTSLDAGFEATAAP
jgi:hypothetical protein